MSVAVPGSKYTGSGAVAAFLSLFERRSKLGLGSFLLRFLLKFSDGGGERIGDEDGDGDGTWVLWDCVSVVSFSLGWVRDLWIRGF